MYAFAHFIVTTLMGAFMLDGIITPSVGAFPNTYGGDCNGNPYDYIIVGGGTAGLALANRLTEDSNTTVLVIERGEFDDSPRAIVPYWSNEVDQSVMMSPKSAPVANLNNATFSVPVAATVGGGSVVNGMAFMRGAQEDYDGWEELGNPGWGWDGLLPYFRKSSTFIPPSPEAAKKWNMTWDLSLYGHGPVHATISDFQYPDRATFWNELKNAEGIIQQRDIGSGAGPGLYWTPSDIDRRDQTRSTSRKAYYEPVYLERPNLKLLTGHTVTEIVFDILTATGVKMVAKSNPDSPMEVNASKEVILSAGATQTIQLLQVSGIGPKKILEAAGIQVKKDLPAVGTNFQDHPTIHMNFNLSRQSFPTPDTIATNQTYNATVWAEYWANRTGPIAAASGSMSVSLSLAQLPLAANDIVSELLAQNASHYLPGIYSREPTILRGFEAQRQIIARQHTSDGAGVSQFPFAGNGLAFSILTKPLSRGTITLNISNPHGLPVVEYSTLSNPLEEKILVSMVRQARTFWSLSGITDAFSPVEASPGAQFQTDEQILFALTKKGLLVPGLAHPSGTCAMMPEELGGCVGPDLRVYGVRRLRIVDASILPMIPSVPLQTTVYAVAEKAADLIKAGL